MTRWLFRLLLVALVVAVSGCRDGTAPASAPTDTVVSEDPTLPIARPSVDAVVPSIVRIVAFGCGAPAVGTGFAVESNMIVTNAHIVSGRDPDTLGVQLLDGTEFSAELVGFDPDTDLAALHIPDGSFTPLNLITEVPIVDGVAIGVRPMGDVNEINEVDFSVDAPVRVNWDGIYRDTESTFRGIRIDADIERGDSGSPLLVNDRDVIGLIQSTTRNQPRGYAVRSSEILGLLNEVDPLVGVVADRCT